MPDQNPGKVALARDKHGVRGLVAAQPFAAGDVLLAVPLERCLVETRDLPAAMKNAPAALTWDVRLALQLHDAILTPDDPFWVEYGTLLPKVEEMGLPLLKRGAELDVLGPELAEPARQQQQRLRELDFPRRSCPRSTRRTTSGRGRCRGRGRSCGRASSARRLLSVSFDDGTSGTTDRFAFVPFVDMANHHADGSAVVDAGDFFIRLRAARDLAPGDAVTISYGDIDRRQHYALYGYWKPEAAGRGDLPFLTTTRRVITRATKTKPAAAPAPGARSPRGSASASPPTT